MDRTYQPLNCVEWCFGYGGLHLGLSRVIPGLRLLALSEIEGYAAANVVAKMEAGRLDQAPNWTDLKTFPIRRFRGVVDLFAAGFPCQPFSCAGQRQADEDPRHLWPHILHFLIATRPGIVVLENVEGIISAKLGGDDWADPAGTPVLLHVLRELERVGYRCTAGIFSASEVGASHQRKRVFIVGVDDASGARCLSERIRPATFCGCGQCLFGAGCDAVADAECSERRQDQCAGHVANGESAGWIEEANRSGERGAAVAHPERCNEAGRLAASGEAGGGRPYGESGGSGGALADAERGGGERREDAGKLGGTEAAESREAYERERDGHATDDCREFMAHTGSRGLHLDGERDRGPEQRGLAASRRNDAHGRDATVWDGQLPWPPGPNERERWARVLERWPWLAPAIEEPEAAEPAVRGSNDGTFAGLDGHRNRIDRLRLCGNGCHPEQVAKAFVALWGELFPMADADAAGREQFRGGKPMGAQ